MNFRPRKQDEPDVNLTPLIDVVFLLLIFFMVSTTFKHEFEVGIELPQSSSEKALENTPVDITIDAKGRYYIDGHELISSKIETLKQALRKVAGDNRKVPIVISADSKTPHQAVITAMDAARQLGFSRLTFATQQPSE